jgi:hypothetical protein
MSPESEPPVLFSKEVDSTLREMLVQRDNEFAALTERLKLDGYKTHVSCTACPVQLHGYLPTSEPFYFRSRHDSASLDIGEKEDKPFDENSEELEWKEDAGFAWVVWSQVKEVGDEMFAASWLDAKETETTLKELYQLYQDGSPSITSETRKQINLNQMNKLTQLFPGLNTE